MWIKNWKNYSLKKQLLIIFSSLSLTTLILTSLTAILFVIISVVQVKNQLYSRLLLQSVNNLKKISLEGTKNFDKKLSNYANNFLNVLAFSTNDCFRKDYPFGYIPSYYNWPGQLINPTYNLLYHANMTLASSTINVYNKTIYDLPNINQTIINTINVTASLDKFFIPLYKYNSDFLAGYIATTSTFLRYYPGVLNNSALSQYINYTPLTDYWFTNTINQKTNKTLFGAPYYDPIAGQFMITISKKIYNGSNLIGAAGGDLILNTIQNDIGKITYLQHGRVILFDLLTNVIIADSFTNYKGVVTYTNVQNPKISDSLWNMIISSNDIINIDNYYIVAQILPNSGNRYILVSIATTSDIYDLFQSTINNITDTLIINIIIICVLSPIIIGLIVLLVIWLTSNIVAPIQKLSNDTTNIISNIGSNLTNNMEEPIIDSLITETKEFQKNYKKLHDKIKLQQQEVKILSDSVINDFYKQTNPWNNASAPLIDEPNYVISALHNANTK